MSRPLCVVIGDIHFTIPTLELATASLMQAIAKAKQLRVPLVINGDTLDTKSVIQARVANRLIEILNTGVDSPTVYINRGNHCQFSEKSYESALRFLAPYSVLIETPTYVEEIKSYIVPYEHDKDKLQKFLNEAVKGRTMIVHQGVQTAHLGHYMTDNSSLPKYEFADFRVIGSHYHRYQDIKCGEVENNLVGMFTYISNPYSLTFGEAEDGPKGFVVLNDDGTVTRQYTNLRRHIIIDRTLDNLYKHIDCTPADIIKYRLTGVESEIRKIKKADIGNKLLGHCNFVFEKIPIKEEKVLEELRRARTEPELLDALIDSMGEAADYKDYIKKVWRAVNENT